MRAARSKNRQKTSPASAASRSASGAALPLRRRLPRCWPTTATTLMPLSPATTIWLWAPTRFMWTAQALGSIKAGFVWIQLLICAVVLVMVPFYRLDKEMPAVRAALAHERKETVR